MKGWRAEISYDDIKGELDRASEDEIGEDVRAVAFGVEARKSGKSVKDMALGVFSDAFWIVKEPMCLWLYFQCVFASDEDLERIETVLVPQYQWAISTRSR